MLGSTESSSTPRDFQPNPAKGLLARPEIASHAWPAPPGKGYIAVGMTRALDSSTGFPSRPRSASWMLVFLMPAEVRRSFTVGRRWELRLLIALAAQADEGS